MSLSYCWALLVLGSAFVAAQELPYFSRFSGVRDMASAMTDDATGDSDMDYDTSSNWARLSGNPPPQRNPLRQMKSTPQAPTQWQVMVSPFMSLLPDVTDYCRCVGMANCGCCLGISLKPIPFQNNVCANVSLSRDDYTGSKHMFRTKLHYDKYKLVDFSVSEREAPKVCLTVPLIPFGGCAQITNIHFDRNKRKPCTCLAVSIEYHERSFLQLPVGCVCVGKPYGMYEKRGLFGLNFLGLAERIKDSLPIIG